MNKYYTLEKYAEIKNVDRSTVSKWATQKKIVTDVVIARSPKLVIEKINDEPNIIALMNLKGGCGKTTLAAHLAAMLSKIKYKVLLIDTDLQNQCRLFFLKQDFQYTLKDVIEDKISINEAIYKTETQTSTLDIVYSDTDIPYMEWDSIPVDKLSKSIEPVKKYYDYIILDTSPNFDKLARSVVMLSTNIIIPIIPDKLNVDGMENYIERVQGLRESELSNVITGIVFNLIEKKAQHEFYIEKFKEEYPDLIFDITIPKYADISSVVNFEKTVFDYREKSKGSQMLKKFVWETLQRL